MRLSLDRYLDPPEDDGPTCPECGEYMELKRYISPSLDYWRCVNPECPNSETKKENNND